MADTAPQFTPVPQVVGNDRGGLLYDRLVALRDLRASNTGVQIRGRVCYSTCTMYLGLPDVCVSPQTTFGFHGPSSYGRRLASADFEMTSRMIAAHYPAPLRNWYLSEGRYRLSGLYYLDGQQIINMGIRAC
ncbi:hypothetical protein [Thalassorhabdomicrobium marinisediminis]|uniref:hypothetical protein n=1 Tax=Thalassorhabdomicrobium marinisediminis TaxID=2170577 RepID=UPI0024913B43|nr:hypothetical protein [Thalassorhabdomicrobium marinisediminis]